MINVSQPLYGKKISVEIKNPEEFFVTVWIISPTVRSLQWKIYKATGVIFSEEHLLDLAAELIAEGVNLPPKWLEKSVC